MFVSGCEALQEVWAELAKVREELKEVKEDRRRERELTHFAQQFTRRDGSAGLDGYRCQWSRKKQVLYDFT